MKIATLMALFLSMLTASGAAFSWTCEDNGELARLVMKQRQEGMPMQDLVRIVNKSNDAPEVKESSLAIIGAAYAEPRLGPDELQRLAITEFQNKIYRLCLM